MDREEVGRNIRRIRKAKNMTQAQLSECIGKSAPALSRCEKGERRFSFETVMKIADVLGVTPNDIAGIEDSYERAYENGRRDATKEITNALMDFIEGQIDGLYRRTK